MNPLLLKDLEKFVNKDVKIKYKYDGNHFVDIIAHITNCHLSATSPHVPVSIEIMIRNDSLKDLIQKGILVPKNIDIPNVIDIELL